MAYRPDFESYLGKLGDEGTQAGGTNAKPGMRLTAQDLQVAGRKLQPFSAVNSSNKIGAEGKKLDPKDFPSQGFNDGQVPGGADSNTAQEVSGTDDWLQKAQQAWQISDAYYQSDIKPKLEDNIRAFNSQHKIGSLYAKSPLGWTSKLYIPKTRTILNKHQAAACIAFFSNQDIVSIEAENPFDPYETIASDFYKKLLQYHMRKTFNWYKNCLGAFQDSMVQGIVIGKVYWDLKANKPAIKVLPLDDVRFDPNCDWIDPVGTSPYWITQHEMTIGEYKELVAGGIFFAVDDQTLSNAVVSEREVQHQRDQSKTSGQSISTISDYNRIMVHEHIHRDGSTDMVYYTLGPTPLLRVSDVYPIDQIYPWGRPYAIGVSDIESHRIISAGFPEVMTGVQEEINELTNQRLNNIKLALNSKYVIREGASVDLDALLVNQPGASVFTDDVEADIRPLETKDVTQSSYMELDKLNAYCDELSGNFNPPSNVSDRKGFDSGRTQQLVNANLNIMLEYRLRTFTETWVTPMIRLIALMESICEDDKKILELVARQIGIVRSAPPEQQMAAQGSGEAMNMVGGMQPAGQAGGGQAGPLPPGQQEPPHNPMPPQEPFTPEHLAFVMHIMNQTVDIQCNVGMNATDPMFKLQKLTQGLGMVRSLVPGTTFDRDEVAKEIVSLCGYADGMRFINRQIDAKDMLIRQLQMQLMMKTAPKEVDAKKAVTVATIREHGANLRKAADIEQSTKELKQDAAMFVAEHSAEQVDRAREVQKPQEKKDEGTPE